MFEKVADPRKVIRWEGQIPIAHRYTPGVAGEAFFRALKERGELLASRCEACGITYCPPRMFCERCFEALEPDRTVGPQGTLESFTVGYAGVEGEPLDRPIVVALVRPDGADTVLMHFLVEADAADRAVGVGDRVELVMKAEAERDGTILDIAGFRPLGPS